MKPEIDYHKNFVNFKKRTETNYIVVHCAATQNKPEYTYGKRLQRFWQSRNERHY